MGRSWKVRKLLGDRVGLEGSLKVLELFYVCVGRILKEPRDEKMGWNGPER